MELTEINIVNLTRMVEEVQRNHHDCNCLISSIPGDVQNIKVNDKYEKTIVRNVSESITMIIIDCRESKIEAISFHGNIKISPKDLYEMYKKYREAHAVKDNLYFYFFNENKEKGNYRISFFEPSNMQVQVMNDTNTLSNLTLTF